MSRQSLASIWQGKQRADWNALQSIRAGNDDVRRRIEIKQHFPACAAWRHDSHMLVRLFRLRMAHRYGAGDGPVSLQDRTAKRDGLGTDREPANRGAQVHAGPDPAVAGAQGGADGVPMRPVMLSQHVTRGFDQFVIRRPQDHSAASASSSGATSIACSTTTDWSRTRFSMLAATSGWSLRKFLAFSRPWPIRWLS